MDDGSRKLVSTRPLDFVNVVVIPGGGGRWLKWCRWSIYQRRHSLCVSLVYPGIVNPQYQSCAPMSLPCCYDTGSMPRSSAGWLEHHFQFSRRVIHCWTNQRPEILAADPQFRLAEEILQDWKPGLTECAGTRAVLAKIFEKLCIHTKADPFQQMTGSWRPQIREMPRNGCIWTHAPFFPPRLPQGGEGVISVWCGCQVAPPRNP